MITLLVSFVVSFAMLVTPLLGCSKRILKSYSEQPNMFEELSLAA
jgi:hypothetical protein